MSLKKIVFATNNAHKLDEVRDVLTGKYEIVSLKELGCTDDIPETADTLEGNALLKAQYINQKYGVDCFADDTGLEVAALDGEPGVYSARYAGESNNAQANMQKLLGKLESATDRSACFRTVIALNENGETHMFEGRVDGHIALTPQGNEGFGYDPIFVPEGFDKSFACLGLKEKNKISHRARAVAKLIAFLQS